MLVEWRAVVGFEEHYEVSDEGVIRSLDRWITNKRGFDRFYKGRVRAPGAINSGYLFVPLKVGGKQTPVTVHRAVMEAFVGPRPKGMDICHINGDKHDNRLVNLRYDTHAANMQDRRQHGTYFTSWNKTHCDQGHEYTPENTKLAKSGGRRCRTCANAATRAHYANHPDYYKARYERIRESR